MFQKIKMLAVVSAVALTSACASTPVIKTNEAMNASKRHVVYAFFVRAGGNQQLVSMIWDNATRNYEIKVASENETFVRAVVESMVSTWGPAIISGVAGIQIGRDARCSSDCGGLVIFNDGSAVSLSSSGAVADADAGAIATARVRN